MNPLQQGPVRSRPPANLQGAPSPETAGRLQQGPYRQPATIALSCDFCGIPTAAKTVVCDNCNHPIGAPIDLARVRREREQCVANRMLAGYVVVGWIVVTVVSGPGISLMALLVPIAWCVRLSLRIGVLNRCLEWGARAAEDADARLLRDGKPGSSESRGSAELPDVSDE